MSDNVVEIVTKMRDEASGPLKQQAEAIEQYKSKVDQAGASSSRASGLTSQLSGAMKGLAGQFALGALAAEAITGAVQGIQQALSKLLSDAIRLNVEMADLTDAMGYLYSDAAEGLISRLDALSESTGYTRSELYALTRDVGAMTAEFAGSQAEAAAMAGSITEASADAAAALGMDLSTATTALQGALRGASRQARQLGIDISQNAVQAELARMGVNQLASEVDEATLLQARYNIALDAMARYSGAAAEELNTLEGAQRQANMAYEEMAIQIGDAAEPMLTKLTAAGADLIPVIGDILTTLVTLLDTAIHPLATSFEACAGLLNLVRDAHAALTAKIVEALPFLGDLKDLWDSIQYTWSDAEADLRALLGLQEEETAGLSTQTAGYRNYVAALNNATAAEIRLTLSMIERLNIMGALNPMVSAARQRLEELKAEAEATAAAVAEAYEAVRRRKKDARGTGDAGEGGGGGDEDLPPPTDEALKDRKAAYIEYLRAIEEEQRGAADRIARHEAEAAERAKRAHIAAQEEIDRAREESARNAVRYAEQMGDSIGDVLAQGARDQITFAEGLEAVGASMIEMIVEAATRAVIAYAAEAAAGAAASQAGIPVVGPALAAAAMASMLALVRGLLGTISGHAAGYIVPGSHAGDRSLAMLEPGERVLTRGEARDYTGRQGVTETIINLHHGSMFAGYSRSDLTRAARMLREVMDAGRIR